MNLKIFRYFLIPHPLKKGEQAVVSDEEQRAMLRNASWEFIRGTANNRPRIMRLLISGAGQENKPDLRQYFRDLKCREDTVFNKIKLKICMRFMLSLITGYLLYIAPPAFWEPIEAVFDSVAHGLSDYAKWWVILFFPVKGFIRTFGTGIQIPLPDALTGSRFFRAIPLLGRLRRIGTAGRWQQIHRTSCSTELYNIFDGELEKEFTEAVEKCIQNIKKKIRCNSRDNGSSGNEEALKLADAFKEIAGRMTTEYGEMNAEAIGMWNREFCSLLERAGKAAGSSGIFPWGEIPKLDRLRQDLLFAGGYDGFRFAPLREICPETSPEALIDKTVDNDSEHVIDLNLKMRIFSAVEQSRKMRIFFSSDEVKGLRERIYRDYGRLSQVGGRAETGDILDSISKSFAGLRDRAGIYHMGPNMMIPNEKGKDLTDYYHRLYLIFGRASCDIRNGYKRSGWGIRPVLSRRAAKARAAEAADQVFWLTDNRRLLRRADFSDKIKSFFGRSAAGGLAATAVLLFLFGSVFSIYSLKPDETAVLNSLRIGYMDRFFNTETSVRHYGTGLRLPGSEREIAWHMPSPITRIQKISSSEESGFTVHMIIGESRTDNPWKKFLQMMSGQLGMNFDVVELQFEYLPASAEVWKNYDADGKGYKRLIRDTSSIVEEWKAGLLASYDEGLTDLQDSSEINYIFTTYFRELSDTGVIEDYIRRSFSQTVLSTHVYYGSPLERYEPGFLTVIDELQRRADEFEQDPLLDKQSKEELKESMDMAREVVEETMERIEMQVTVDYGDLRRNPDKLMELVRDPYSHLQELRDFETLWSGIQNYTWHLYNQEKMKEIFSGGRRDMPAVRNGYSGDYVIDLMYAVADDPHLSKLIRLRAVTFRIMDMGVSQLNLIQQKWKDII